MEPYPPVDVFAFACRLVESLGVKLDHPAIGRQLIQVANGQVTVVGSLEEEIAAAPESEAYLRSIHRQRGEWRSMQEADQLMARQILAGLNGLHLEGTPS